jgi:hypothetical protein
VLHQRQMGRPPAGFPEEEEGPVPGPSVEHAPTGMSVGPFLLEETVQL